MTRLPSLLLLSALLACGSPPLPEPPEPIDTDGDGILDVHEGDADPDGDGKPAYADLDSDGDGLRDEVEAGDDILDSPPFDMDADGTPDFLDLDSDGNGLPDAIEGFDDAFELADRDRDGLFDSSDLDDDSDGIPDRAEMGADDVDSDGDRIPDRLDRDSDNDGLRDLDEGACAFPPCDTDEDGVPDRLDDDSDNDGLSDADESGVDTGLARPPRDTDGDGIYDARDPDSDGDGLSDAEELEGATDGLLADSDGDGLSDWIELDLGTDPVDPDSRWGGRVVSVPARQTVGAAVDVELGVAKLDVVLLGEHVYQPSPYVTVSVAEAAFQNVPEPAASTAYALVQTGHFGALPWGGCMAAPENCGYPSDTRMPVTAGRVLVPMITDRGRLHAWWASLDYDLLQDAPISEGRAYLEALYQVATGRGYDVGCDGVFDPWVDQPPFQSQPDDLFGGAGIPTWDPSRFSPAGSEGGVGFRSGSARIVIKLPFDALLLHCELLYRPDLGAPPPGASEDLSSSWFTGPDLCRPHVDPLTTAEALAEARVWVSDFTQPDLSPSRECLVPEAFTAVETLRELAWATASVGDMDGDGEVEPWIYEAGSPAREGGTLISRWLEVYQPYIDAITSQVRERLQPDRIHVEVRDDPHGFLRGVTPDRTEGLRLGDTVSLDLDLLGAVPPAEGDRAYRVKLAVVGNEQWDLWEEEILVIVPGWTSME